MANTPNSPMLEDDYVGSDYYAENYENLLIAHTKGITSTGRKCYYLEGNPVIVAARNTDNNIYGFVGTVVRELDTTADKYWPKADANPVYKLQVHCPITLIPSELYSEPGQSGFRASEREAITEHLLMNDNV